MFTFFFAYIIFLIFWLVSINKIFSLDGKQKSLFYGSNTFCPISLKRYCGGFRLNNKNCCLFNEDHPHVVRFLGPFQKTFPDFQRAVDVYYLLNTHNLKIVDIKCSKVVEIIILKLFCFILLTIL